MRVGEEFIPRTKIREGWLGVMFVLPFVVGRWVGAGQNRKQ